MTTTTDIPISICPHCGYKMDQATGADTIGKPRPGDVSICAKCAEITIFDEQLCQRAPTPDEAREINMIPVIIRAQIMIRGGNFLKNATEAQAKQRKQNGKRTTGEQH